MSRPPRQIPLPLRLDDETTFANFLVTEPNRLLVEQLISTGAALNRYLWIRGAAASGRTHLLQALCHQHEDRGLRSQYIPLSLYREFSPALFENLDTMALVCLDDVDAVTGQADWELSLFNLYNQLAESGTHLVIAAGQSPAQIGWQLADLASRLQAGLVFQMAPLSDEEKVQALQLRARSRGFELPVEVASYLLLRSDRDMNSLSSVLQRLDDLALEKKRRITVPLLKELLENPH